MRRTERAREARHRGGPGEALPREIRGRPRGGRRGGPIAPLERVARRDRGDRVGDWQVRCRAHLQRGDLVDHALGGAVLRGLQVGVRKIVERVDRLLVIAPPPKVFSAYA